MNRFRRPRDNLIHEERKALRELKSMNYITIKPADKGLAVVIQNTSHYIAEGLRQLRDRSLNMGGGGGAGGFRQIFREQTSGPPSNFAKNSVAPPSDLAKK